MAKFGIPVVVALNRFPDTQKEIDKLYVCSENNVNAVLSEHWGKGGAGVKDLATEVPALMKAKQI